MSDRTPDPGPPTEQVDWEALARYLAGESSAAEAEAMRRWLDAQPDRAELVAALDRSMNRLAYQAPHDLDVEGALRSVRARRDLPDVRVLPNHASRASRRTFAPPTTRWTALGLRAAAVLAAVAVGAGLLWQTTRRDEGRRAAPAAAAQMFTTAVGERDSLRLPDGTRVVLGPGSRLAVDQGYGSAHREVGLRGEAYFDVQHDGTHPFTVRAGNGTVRDVGTAFAVHSDPGDGVRVVVTSGAVVLKAGNAPADSGVTLRQGDRGVLYAGGRVVAERGAATEEDLAWTRGQLVFRDAPLAQVRADLRRWYGIELRPADSTIADKHVTTTFAGEPPQRVLELLALILGANVELHGDTAVLRARSANVRRR
jgi:transmembrane sensor